MTKQTNKSIIQQIKNSKRIILNNDLNQIDAKAMISNLSLTSIQFINDQLVVSNPESQNTTIQVSNNLKRYEFKTNTQVNNFKLSNL